MKIRTMLQKIIVAMHNGRPSLPEDKRWDRAVDYAERLLRDCSDIEYKSEVYDQLKALVDSESTGTINICSSPDQSPRYYVAFRVNAIFGEHLLEARADTLLECLTSIANQKDRLAHE